MYSNNMVNFQESTTILNTRTKKSGDLLKAPRKYKYAMPLRIYTQIDMIARKYVHLAAEELIAWKIIQLWWWWTEETLHRL